MIKRFTIFGERCSGTNYIEELILANTDLEITWDYGWKHFFGFNDYKNSDDVLFICTARHPIFWIDSFFNHPHHMPEELTLDINSFLNKEFYSIDDNNNEILEDRNIYTKKRYKNIFEMRYIKLNYMLITLPKLIKNTSFVKYENFRDSPKDELIKLKKNFKLNIDIKNIKNIEYYKKDKNIKYKKQENFAFENIILKNKNFQINFEKKIGYYKSK